ncbi:hypothetical protein RB195_010355 [Necator americanus]|uniref:DUF5641 domain-containing protein n=1 Tax=Necator americanus TaxID=51031 RepID=A0ABR1CXL1_NECAM
MGIIKRLPEEVVSRIAAGEVIVVRIGDDGKIGLEQQSDVQRYYLANYTSEDGVVIREKQRILYTVLLKCHAKEQACRRLLPNRIWKKIEGGSRAICDIIRSNAKSTLRAKYDRLSSTHRDPVCENNTSIDHQLPISSNQNTNTDRTARVTVIGDTHVSDNVMDFLSLGPSFSIAQNVNGAVFRKVVGGLQRLRDQHRIKAKHENTPQSTFLSRKLLPPVPFPRTFYKEPEPVREADVKFRIVSVGVLAAFNQHRNQRHRNLTKYQWQGFREVRELISNGTLRISVSDKGGEYVVMPSNTRSRNNGTTFIG